MPTTEQNQSQAETHCDQCDILIQAKRNNKSGPRYCGSACRQKAFRLQKKVRKESELEASQRRAERLSSAEHRAANLARELMETSDQVDSLRRYNKNLHTQLKNLKLVEEADSMTTLSVGQIERLGAFDDAQLRNWVKTALAFVRSEKEDPVESSIRHTEGNRIAGSLQGGNNDQQF